MSLCPYAYLRVSLSSSLTASEQGSLMTIGEFLNVSALDPLLPTFLIATLCLCALSVITYYSLAVAWEVFWASRRSPLPLDSSTKVVLTGGLCILLLGMQQGEREWVDGRGRGMVTAWSLRGQELEPGRMPKCGNFQQNFTLCCPLCSQHT